MCGDRLEAFRSECVPGAERGNGLREGGATLGVSVEGRSERQAPTVAVADGEAVVFQFEQGIAETGVVDAQPLTQGGSGQRRRGLLESGAHRFGERRRCGGVAVEAQGKRQVAASVQTQQDRIGRGGGAMLDGEQQASPPRASSAHFTRKWESLGRNGPAPSAAEPENR